MLFATPILFILQIILLPIYFLIFLNQDFSEYIDFIPFLKTFVYLILIPLLIAIFMQILSKKSDAMSNMLSLSEWLPVPFMGLVLMTVIGSQISKSLMIYTSYG